jgi:hypothetical protein
MVRKKAKPVSRVNHDVDADVELVAIEIPSQQQYVLVNTDSSDNSSAYDANEFSSDSDDQYNTRASIARPQVKRGRNAAGGAAAPRAAAPTCKSTAPAQVILVDSSDSCDEESGSVAIANMCVKQIWSFPNLTFDHQDFSFLYEHFKPSSFCIAFVVVDVFSHLLPVINSDALGYCSGISCEVRPEVSGTRSNNLHFVLRSSSDAFSDFYLKFEQHVSELSAEVHSCLRRGLLSMEQGIWSTQSSRFLFPLELNLEKLSQAPASARIFLLRIMSKYRPQQFFQPDEDNSQPLPVDQILEFICRRPEEHVEPCAEFVTPTNIPGISTCLKGYQREAVAWARCVEAGTAIACGGKDLVALPLECSISQRKVLFDPVMCQVAAPSSDDPEQFKVYGGMLCDEMGLGKTLECLSLIMLTRNAHRRNSIMPSAEHILPQSQSLHPETDYRCICGNNDLCCDDAVQCENCLYWLHVRCVPPFEPDLPYFCLSCRSHVRSPLESDCTLIISPSSICGQVRSYTRPLSIYKQVTQRFFF